MEQVFHYILSFNLLGNLEGQNSRYSSSNSFAVLKRIQIIQATDVLILVNILKQKHLEPSIANSRKNTFFYEHLHKYV